MKVLHETEPHLSDKNSIIIRSFDTAARRLGSSDELRDVWRKHGGQEPCTSRGSLRSFIIRATTNWLTCRMSLSSSTNWCWARCFMPRHSRLISLANSSQSRGRCAETLRKLRRYLCLYLWTCSRPVRYLRPRRACKRGRTKFARRWTRGTLIAPKRSSSSLRASDAAAFTRNNYDYLLARLAERRGARAEASSLYLELLSRKSALAEYALWHLALNARASGELALERQYITRLLAEFPASALVAGARERLIDSLDSGDFRGTIALLRPSHQVPARGDGARWHVWAKPMPGIGDAQSARSLFTQLVNGSRDDYALQGAWGSMRSIGLRGKSRMSLKPFAARGSTCRIATGPKLALISSTSSERFPEPESRGSALSSGLCLLS